MVIDGTTSNKVPVINGVPKGTVLRSTALSTTYK